MKNKQNIIIIYLLYLTVHSQNARANEVVQSSSFIDSLISVVKTSSDTFRVNTMNLISRQFFNIGNYEKAIEYGQEAQRAGTELNFQKGVANAFNNIGNAYLREGDYEKSLTIHLKSLKLREQMGDKKGIAASYSNIGLIYASQQNYEQALNTHYKSLKIREEIGDLNGMAVCYNNIGIVYSYQKKYEKALENQLKSLRIKEKIGSKEGIATSYSNLGLLYVEQKNYSKALDSHFKSLKICEEIGDKYGIAINNLNLGNIYLIQNKLDQSTQYLNKASRINKEIRNKDGLKDVYNLLAELYNKKSDYKKAFGYHKLYSDIKDTLLNEQSSKQIAEMNTRYESEKKEKDIELLTKDKSLQQAEIGKQKFIRNATAGGLVLALILALVLFNRFKLTNKQKKVIEFQNFQIVESINYSKKIQNSLLPSIVNMQKIIPSLFVFYQPKAIVSGDFYYFKEFEKYTLLACVDCTGHGVPGGFMSTLGSLLLDKIANNEALSPSEIMNKLSKEIIRVLHQQDGGEIQDGMDLSVCLIDRNNRKIEFSGARNGIIVVTNNEAKRYKADTLPVGGNYMKKGIPIERNFKTQSIPINTTDWIYMYTDGFMEQVGGTEGIPMNYTQFEDHLINLSQKHAPEEKCELLQEELDNWRGVNQRDDDVLIMGFQVG